VAKGPICIITPTGMVCCSSRPMKRHFPNEGKEDATAETEKVYTAVEGALGRVSGRDTILTVVQLMVQAKVTDAMPFTITATMGEGARKSKSKK
jgi:hypothetical protein